MEHRLIQGGEQYLPFARSRIKSLKALGLTYANQSFEVDGVSIRVRIEPGHEYIRLSRNLKVDMWCLSKEWVDNTPMLCVYSLKSMSLTAKRMAMFQLHPGTASSSTENIKGTTTAWVANGVVGSYKSVSTTEPPKTITGMEVFGQNTSGELVTLSADATVAGDTSTVVSSTFAAGYSSSAKYEAIRHRGDEPGFSGSSTAYADFVHKITNYSGVGVNPPTFSYYGGALKSQTYTYPPTTHSLGALMVPIPPSFLNIWANSAPPVVGGTPEGVLSIAPVVYPVTPGAILTELQPGTINSDIWFGNGKGGTTESEFSYGYYIPDALSSINPVTGKYVLRMFKDYYFAFENDLGRRIAKTYSYDGTLIENGPVIHAPDYPVWNDRLMPPSIQNPATIAQFRKEYRRWMNVGKNSTVYEWIGLGGDAMFGAVAHGNSYMQTIKTQDQVFGVLDLETRPSHPWFVPVRPYIVGPDIASMTPYASEMP